VPVDWSPTDSPRRQVLTVLAETVGYGETISYGALARRAGLPAEHTAARDVGTIMASNTIPLIVPCHRVLASDGLGGYSGGAGLEVKRWLLILEGSHPPTLDWQPMTAG
jgi:methylated-DNA-[protein]-cysteine S-methyltransferase